MKDEYTIGARPFGGWLGRAETISGGGISTTFAPSIRIRRHRSTEKLSVIVTTSG